VGSDISEEVHNYYLYGGVAGQHGFFSLTGTQQCCEKTDPEVQALLVSAERGDLKSIRELYKRADSDGVAPMAEYWAYTGALGGDREMRSAYVEIFRTRFDLNRQKKVLTSLEGSTMPGATCLLAQLSGADSIPTQCK
jgi:hypothetical protein